MTKKQLIDSFEQVDEFCIQVEDIDETTFGSHHYDKEEPKVGRYEYICTKDLDLFHTCNKTKNISIDCHAYHWEIVKVHFDEDGYFDGIVLIRCKECGKEFESKYTPASDNPEVINKEEFEGGSW